jgi:hypothetical protein
MKIVVLFEQDHMTAECSDGDQMHVLNLAACATIEHFHDAWELFKSQTDLPQDTWIEISLLLPSTLDGCHGPFL